jgi:hypothetical protein
VCIWLQSLHTVRFALPIDNDALRHYKDRAYDVSEHTRRAPEFDPLTSSDIPSDLAADDASPDMDLGLYFALLAHQERLYGQQFAPTLSVEGQCSDKFKPALNFTAMINDRGGAMIQI